MLHIGEVAQKLGLNRQTIYFYERIALIPPPQRSGTGYRLFSEEDIERLSLITRLKGLGMKLDEIQEILALKDRKQLTCQAVYEKLTAKIESIERKIEKLKALREELLPLRVLAYQRLQKALLANRCQQCTLLDELIDLEELIATTHIER
jgi:DNA-binding transcriptional MerR regulator